VITGEPVEETISTAEAAAKAAQLEVWPPVVLSPEAEDDPVARRWSKYSMVQSVGLGERSALAAARAVLPQLDRAVGSMVGMAVGDAVGAPLEYAAVENGDGLLGHFTLSTGAYVGAANRFGLKPGQWTDDSSMGICLADSLLANPGAFNGSDARAR
jgi:hypothetical protein